MDKGERICVGVRVRPLNERESGKGSCCTTEDGRVVALQHQSDKIKYSFDKVFDEKAETEAVFNNIAQEIVRDVTKGKNGTVLACKCNF